MNDLKPVAFLIPVIALMLAAALYFFLLKETSNKKPFKEFVLVVSGVAFLLNLAWELLQVPLFEGASYNFKHIAFCAVAAVADAIMVLLLYFGFALLYNNSFWINDLTFRRGLILILVGGAGAVLAEVMHTAKGSWAYADAMPIIPVVNVGLSPVLQFMILPVIIYYISSYITINKRQKK
jgi:arginine exporter protein ArgO